MLFPVRAAERKPERDPMEWVNMKIRAHHMRWHFVILALALLLPGPHTADGDQRRAGLVRGQTVYVPAYSHIYSGNREIRLYLAATLSIRNTAPEAAIRLIAVDYHDSEGKRVKKMLDAPFELGPLATTRYVIKESDKTGGSGASFIVRWQADRPVIPPLIEAIMISTKSQSGVSFTSRGQVISEEY